MTSPSYDVPISVWCFDSARLFIDDEATVCALQTTCYAVREQAHAAYAAADSIQEAGLPESAAVVRGARL
jgi:hypothetical protein